MKKDKCPKDHISWCCKQKRGIKLEESNNNLCNVYINKELDKENLKKDSETARNFVLNMEEVIENITEEQITGIRDKLANKQKRGLFLGFGLEK